MSSRWHRLVDHIFNHIILVIINYYDAIDGSRLLFVSASGVRNGLDVKSMPYGMIGVVRA